MTEIETPVRRITLAVCEFCLAGDNGECHVPGCAFWAARAPDKPLSDERGRLFAAALRELDEAETPMPAWQPPADLDPECLTLCKAINDHCPGLITTSSCCGHAERPYWIFFAADTVDALLPLLYWADRCHSGCNGWQVIASTDCAAHHVTFRLEGPAGAFEDAGKIAAFLADSPA